MQPRQPDPAYLDEYEAARAAGLPVHVVSTESLIEEHDPDRTVRWITPESATAPAIFRGYMLTLPQYTDLYAALASRNLLLINTPDQYALCHYLPNNYSLIKGVTPESVWFESGQVLDIEKLSEALAKLGAGPAIVKDYVKSEKHYWREACYIPNALDFRAAESVVRRFLELRGSSLNKGIVLRRYVPLVTHGHSARGLPQSVEARLFYYRRRVLSVNAYWTQTGEIPGAESGVLAGVADCIDSNFFTLDVAKTADGAWLVMELGDGQVAGLPPGLDAARFYAQLRNV